MVGDAVFHRHVAITVKHYFESSCRWDFPLEHEGIRRFVILADQIAFGSIDENRGRNLPLPLGPDGDYLTGECLNGLRSGRSKSRDVYVLDRRVHLLSLMRGSKHHYANRGAKGNSATFHKLTVQLMTN
jgi:hypothetical protein